MPPRPAIGGRREYIMARYYINYGTGAGNEWITGTLEDAQTAADAGAAYAQESISIYDEDGYNATHGEYAQDADPVCMRRWWDVKFDPAEDDAPESDIISYGDCGYYGAWQA